VVDTFKYPDIVPYFYRSRDAKQANCAVLLTRHWKLWYKNGRQKGGRHPTERPRLL